MAAQQRNSLTYGECINLLGALTNLNTFVGADGKQRTSWFGLYHIKIAQAMNRLRKIETEYTELKNDIIRKYLSDGIHEVPKDKQAQVSEELYELGATESGLTLEQLPKIPLSVFESEDAKVSIYDLSFILDLTTE